MAEVPHSTLSQMKSFNTWNVNAVLGSFTVAGKSPDVASWRCDVSAPGQLQYLTSQKCTPDVWTNVRHDLSIPGEKWCSFGWSSISSHSSSTSLVMSSPSSPPLGHGSPPGPRCTTNLAYQISWHYLSSRISNSQAIGMTPQRMCHSIAPHGGKVATCVPSGNKSCRITANGCIWCIYMCHLLDTVCRPSEKGVPPCLEAPGGTSACMATILKGNYPIIPSGGHGTYRFGMNHTWFFDKLVIFHGGGSSMEW